LNEAALRERVQFWAATLGPLGVGHFTITNVSIVDEPDPNEEAKASIELSGHYDECEFRFARSFVENCSRQELDQSIVHEWLHAAWRDHDMIFEVLEKRLSPSAYDDFMLRQVHETEGIIDRVSRTIIALYNAK
jgi:hypothetical protein